MIDLDELAGIWAVVTVVSLTLALVLTLRAPIVD